jgi:hypothetical protein
MRTARRHDRTGCRGRTPARHRLAGSSCCWSLSSESGGGNLPARRQPRRSSPHFSPVALAGAGVLALSGALTTALFSMASRTSGPPRMAAHQVTSRVPLAKGESSEGHLTARFSRRARSHRGAMTMRCLAAKACRSARISASIGSEIEFDDIQRKTVPSGYSARCAFNASSEANVRIPM